MNSTDLRPGRRAAIHVLLSGQPASPEKGCPWYHGYADRHQFPRDVQGGTGGPEFEPWLWPKQPGTRYKNKLLACYFYLTTLFSIVFAQTKGELTGVLFQISAHPCDCSRLYCIIFFNRPTLMVCYFDPFCKCVKLENCSASLNPDHGYTVKRIMPYTVN